MVEEKKKLPKRPCKTCKNSECSKTGDAYGQEFICTSFISGDELEQKAKAEEHVEKLKEDLMGVWGGGFPF